jgi:hypothetical protein
MCKESSAAMDCIGCGRRIIFMDYHLPHCQPARDRLTKLTGKKVTIEKVTSRIQERPRPGARKIAA